jgi:hypothetical protein
MKVEVINKLVIRSVLGLIIFSFFCSCSCDDCVGCGGVGCNGAVVVIGGIIGCIIGGWIRLVTGCCEEEDKE